MKYNLILDRKPGNTTIKNALIMHQGEKKVSTKKIPSKMKTDWPTLLLYVPLRHKFLGNSFNVPDIPRSDVALKAITQ